MSKTDLRPTPITGKAAERLYKTEYKTLEQQIIELWKSRGITVAVIQVKPNKDGSLTWSVTGKHKLKG